MLASMFAVPPFNSKPYAPQNKPPCLFIWANTVGLPSSFARIEQPASSSSSPSRRQPTTLGLEVEGERLYRSYDSNPWEEYGFLAAQRRSSGQVWLVVAGLTGAMTYATARFIETFSERLPLADAKTHSPVLWAVVKATIESHKDRRGDDREVKDYQLFRGPNLCNPHKPN
jgi:hypothetical protein